MGTVGLLYVGAVLFLNGVMLLGKVDPRAAGIFNLFVGAMQVITPTVLIVQAGDTIGVQDWIGDAGIYLFGFTYLYVGVGLLGGFDSTGVGWFSLFVAVMACGFSFLNFRIATVTGADHNKPFGVIWLMWAFLWFLFFLLLGLKMDYLRTWVGWVTAIEGWVTAAIPAFLIIGGYWLPKHYSEIAIALGAFSVVVFGGLYPLTVHRPPRAPAVAYPEAAPGYRPTPTVSEPAPDRRTT